MWPDTLTAVVTTALGAGPVRDRSLLPVMAAWRVCYSSSVAGAAVVASIGVSCRHWPRRNGNPDNPHTRRGRTTASAAISVPQNPADRNIRRDLNLAIARDTDLRNRHISFIVTNGDVSVTGTVRTEKERRKINDLAMNIGGVKSVANALLVAE